jgi:hypothetical protein
MENTIVGKLASYMRIRGAMTMADCVGCLTGHYDELRKPDNSKYKGTLEKAINGALSSTGVFSKAEDNKWIFREDEIRDYEARLLKKFEAKSKMRKTLNKRETTAAHGVDKKSRKTSCEDTKRLVSPRRAANHQL